MATAFQQYDSAKLPVLYMTLELANKTWRVGFHNTVKCISKTIDAGDLIILEQEIRLAKEKLNASVDCAIKCCYETE